MKVEQISIFIENKSGRLAEVARVLGEKNVNIRALSLADTSDFGILRLLVDNTDLALATLKESGFTVSKTEVIAVEVPDQPGGLYKILQVLDDARINVEYMYAFAERNADNAVIICRFDETDAAINTLREKGVNILAGDRLYKL
ncbi:MAG: ACT domain-containing protein [Desulfuromonadales bacterium]|nr:ACT domain-containing protein [Desulfuromonadales bacterium]